MDNVAIVGLGVTGLSVVEHLYPEMTAGRCRLTVVDTRAAPPGLETLTRDYPDVEAQLDVDVLEPGGLDRLVVSPGIALDAPLLGSARRAGLPMVSDIDLFSDAAAAPVIGITGTNGKSTVTALTGHLLDGGGRLVRVGGNLGEPALKLLDENADLYVLELSSFQLERLAPVPFAAATILNVSEDHLDRYSDFDAYKAAKRRIYQRARRIVFNRDDPATNPPSGADAVSVGLDEPGAAEWGITTGRGERMLRGGGRDLCPVAALPLAGAHNCFNALAALALCDAMDVDPASVVDRLGGFPGLAHRCVRVATSEGVAFVNDSKATNVGACIAALDGLGQARNIVLIAGGDTKGANFAPLKEAVARHVKRVVLLGVDTAELHDALAGVSPIEATGCMREAVDMARSAAEAGDIVLLSPACASFDLFDNFEHRGRQFEACVRELVK